jgi:hypothetical protein
MQCLFQQSNSTAGVASNTTTDMTSITGDENDGDFVGSEWVRMTGLTVKKVKERTLSEVGCHSVWSCKRFFEWVIFFSLTM